MCATTLFKILNICSIQGIQGDPGFAGPEGGVGERVMENSYISLLFITLVIVKLTVSLIHFREFKVLAGLWGLMA